MKGYALGLIDVEGNGDVLEVCEGFIESSEERVELGYSDDIFDGCSE